MSLYRQFKTDSELEKTGILLNYGKNSQGEDINIRVARAGGANQAYLKLVDAKAKPIRRQIQQDTVEREKLEGLIRDAFIDTVVLGWEGVEDEANNPLPFSKENCRKLFKDLPDLYSDVQEQASRFALFRQDIQEADAKN